MQYSQGLIFFVTYESVKQARLFVHGCLSNPNVINHYNLFGPFVSYEENEVLWIRYQELYLQHFIFFVTYELAE